MQSREVKFSAAAASFFGAEQRSWGLLPHGRAEGGSDRKSGPAGGSGEHCMHSARIACTSGPGTVQGDAECSPEQHSRSQHVPLVDFHPGFSV